MITVSVSDETAVKLFLTNEIAANNGELEEKASSFFYTLLHYTITDLLAVVDSVTLDTTLTSDAIPQFGNISSLLMVPNLLLHAGGNCYNYAQLGLQLKGDPDASITANTKFGENHGKTVSLMGLTTCRNRRFYLSDLTITYCDLDPFDQEEVMARLFFRIPYIQMLIKKAKEGKVDAYSCMGSLSDSTKARRGQSNRAILRRLEDFNNDELSRRLQNIVWKK